MPDTYQERQKSIVKGLRGNSGHRNIGAPVVVSPRSDYRTDSAICLTSVVFVPEDMAQDIYQTMVEPLKKIEPDHHYYSPDAMHITIKNIRTVHDPPLFTEMDVKKVHHLFTALIPQHHRFTFSLEELIAFTASVSLIGYCDDRLKALVQALDAGLNEIGVPDNKHYVSDTVFFGNVTLCRYARQPSRKFYEAVEHKAQVHKRALKVEAIHLITCNSVCAPESRTVLNSYKLRERLSC